MRFRVQDILLVTSHYDSFILSEDGKLQELILGEFLELNLRHAPGLTQVSSGAEALVLAKDVHRYNLIIASFHVGDMSILQLARRVREAGLDTPVVLLAYDNRELTEYTQVIIHEADRLQSLVDRLLAPHRHPHLVGDVNIHEVCERVRSLVLVEYPQGLKVQRDYDTSIPEFRGDRAQLIQAVLNIVQNAAQALSERIAKGDAVITLRTRVARQVTFGRQRYRLALELHVIDNGPGVPDAIKDRIFYPLVSGRDGGSGLGLTLAQTFVQRHHGLIECDSVPGRTDFRILIPLP